MPVIPAAEPMLGVLEEEELASRLEEPASRLEEPAGAACFSVSEAREKRWGDLNLEEQAHANTLGYEVATWDGNKLPPGCVSQGVDLEAVMMWDELPADLMRATSGSTGCRFTFGRPSRFAVSQPSLPFLMVPPNKSCS